jgi:hypothetical protein
MIDLKTINLKAINRYVSPRAFNDLNAFLEKLPSNVGQTALLAIGIAWATAAGLGLYTSIKAQDLNNLRAQLQDAQALKPIVPVINEVAVETAAVDAFVKHMTEIYKNLEIRNTGNAITMNSDRTGYYALFREAVAQVQNGGAGWKVSLDGLCVGRECKQKQLSIALKINKISIDKPVTEPITYLPTSKDPSTNGAP